MEIKSFTIDFRSSSRSGWVGNNILWRYNALTLIFMKKYLTVWFLYLIKVKNLQFNAKQSFRFGEMKIVIEHITNQSPTILFVPDIVKVVLMRARVTAVVHL